VILINGHPDSVTNNDLGVNHKDLEYVNIHIFITRINPDYGWSFWDG
jgi:hypothetical protein